jgi:cobalt/nickel transport protein
MKTINKLWIGIIVLIILTPVGLILPEHFKAGSAWGEWGADEMQKLIGYVPKGLAKLSSLWDAPMADYDFKGWGEKGLSYLSFAYIISALVGICIIILAVTVIGRLLAKRSDYRPKNFGGMIRKKRMD